jgi:hypothetical protein
MNKPAMVVTRIPKRENYDGSVSGYVSSERYYVDGVSVSKQAYLEAGGQDVPSQNPCNEVFPDGHLEVKKTSSGITYSIDGVTVSRQTWLSSGLNKLLVEDGILEVGRLERKAFGNIKNYLHNTLGITKKYVQDMVQSLLEKQLKEIVREELGLVASTPVQMYKDHNVKKMIREIVSEELKKTSNISDWQKYTTDLTKREIEAHVLSRLKIDIRVQTVNPEEGVLREVISPTSDTYRGVRD